MTQQSGTDLNDVLDGTQGADTILGQGGDDTISGAGGDDLLIGDYDPNLLQDGDAAMTLSGYGDSSAWTVTQGPDGHTAMSQTVDTVMGATYALTFDIAANLGGGSPQGAIEIVWNGEVISTYQANSGVFDNIDVSFTGTGEPGTLTFRSVDPTGDGPAIDTAGPIWSYDQSVTINGTDVTVAAFAEGQPNLYQVLNGTLMVFDPETSSYTQAGADATVVVNAIGFNTEDNLIYGIAVSNGVDALGNAVSQKDLVMLDADGNSYRIGETSYRSWTGDFDDKGNLWAFEADMDYFMAVDVSERDADGNPVVTKFNLPDEMITDRVWDVAFAPSTQTFRGVIRPSGEGQAGKLITIDVSGPEPIFDFVEVTGTVINGVLVDGLPAVTFGAAICDADGTLYVGGNSGDHDMDDATGSSGGFYRVDTDPETGEVTLVLVADAPKAASNDGASDPRAIDPFSPMDVSAAILIRDIVMTQDPSGGASFDDTLDGNAGDDTLHGNQGEDTLLGSSGGDTLHGGTDDDALYGGAGPGWTGNGLISVYDEDGNRFDQFGNPLPADDDFLFGGAGEDLLSGSAGHDVLDGGTGNDTLSGGSGFDTLFGGQGDDTLRGGRNEDALFGGDGNDTLLAGSGDDTLQGGAGIDVLRGQSGDDVVAGGDGADTLRGDRGDDQLDGGAGNDRLNGGSGNDTLVGGDGKDLLNGSKGDDTLDGGAGNDRLYLGQGDDVATGGAGSDRFIFRSQDLDGSVDIITDFTFTGAQADQLDLRQLNLGQDAGDWIADNVTFEQGVGLVIDLGGSSLILEDTGHGASMAMLLEDTLLM